MQHPLQIANFVLPHINLLVYLIMMLWAFFLARAKSIPAGFVKLANVLLFFTFSTVVVMLISLGMGIHVPSGRTAAHVRYVSLQFVTDAFVVAAINGHLGAPEKIKKYLWLMAFFGLGLAIECIRVQIIILT